jgi:hypothetical protein
LGGVGVTGSNQSNDDVQRLVDAVMARWGRIDVLVNSAGHGPRAPLIEITDEAWHQGIDIYFLSAVRPIRAVTPIMEAQGSGAIVNITTFATFEPDPAFPTSGVARAGLAAFRQALRRPVCGEGHPHQQPAARLHRQPAGEGGVPRPHPDGPLWQGGRDRLHGRLPRLGRGGLHHRAEPAGRWRSHPVGVDRDAPRATSSSRRDGSRDE